MTEDSYINSNDNDNDNDALKTLLDLIVFIVFLIPVALIIWGMTHTIRINKKRKRKHDFRISDNRKFAWAMLGWILLLIIAPGVLVGGAFSLLRKR